MRRSGTRHLLSMADLDRDDIEAHVHVSGALPNEVRERNRLDLPTLPGCHSVLG